MIVSFQVLLFFGPLLAFLLVYPWLVRRSMRAVPVKEPGLRGSLDALLVEQRHAIDDFVVWNTRDRLRYAAIVGAIPWKRFIVLTDGLLGRLDATGVLAMVRHEVAHARRWHPAARVLLVSLPLWCWLWLQPLIPDGLSPAIEYLRERMSSDANPEFLKFLLVPFALTIGLRLALGRLSRLLEHDADLCSCGFYDQPVVPEKTLAATRDLSAALERLVPRGQRDEVSWLHPSVNSRLRLVAASLEDPRLAARVQRASCFIVRLLCVSFLAVPLIAQLT